MKSAKFSDYSTPSGLAVSAYCWLAVESKCQKIFIRFLYEMMINTDQAPLRFEPARNKLG